MELRYGINPEQRAWVSDGAEHVRVVAGEPSYINLLDALNAWQLVRASAVALGRPTATTFKHVSPAGAALSGPVDNVMADTWAVTGQALSPVASAYVRARDCDPKSSFGDIVAVSEPVDVSLAKVLASVVSDGIVAPGFEPGTTEVLATKKAGRYLVLEVSPDYEPPGTETRDVFGIRLQQQTTKSAITTSAVRAGTSGPLPDEAVDDLVLGMITARYTQSNTMVYVKDAMVLGVGSGQQSRVDCTKLAGVKVDTWWLRRHPAIRSIAFKPEVRRQDRINWQIRLIEGDISSTERERLLRATEDVPSPLAADHRAEWLEHLDRISLASDGYIPFRDNIDHAARHGVRFIAHPGGSVRNDEVTAACREYGITITATGIRLFHH